ncbi:hypothetical protein BH10BDE1_BH10BDE1_08390 [soil metagenome]
MKKTSKGPWRDSAMLLRTMVVFCLVAFQVGCATNQQKRWAITGSAVAVGLAVGSASAPENERKELHAVYWGALLGLGAALISQEVFSDSKEIERLTLENQKQNLQLDVMQSANTVLLREGKGSFKAGEKGGETNGSAAAIGAVSNQGSKAKWRLFQIDKWVKGAPNQLIHQDKMVEITPLENAEGSK